MLSKLKDVFAFGILAYCLVATGMAIRTIFNDLVDYFRETSS